MEVDVEVLYLSVNHYLGAVLCRAGPFSTSNGPHRTLPHRGGLSAHYQNRVDRSVVVKFGFESWTFQVLYICIILSDKICSARDELTMRT